MPPSKNFTLALLFCFSLILLNSYASAIKVSHDGRSITIDGKPRILLSGSIHYPRSTPEMWPELIKKSKEGGLDAIETYVFWNAHEPVRRQYDFTGNLDLIKFIKTVQDAGLYVVLRIGPYVCAEWNYGGLPVWLHNLPGCQIRTANDVFMNEMKNFTTMIVDMAKREKLFASQGGPIIMAQIENEYGDVEWWYGAAGKAYRDWCANFAESLNVGVPWIMCQQNDAPDPMINTCNGYYCDQFTPKPNYPKMWTENWTGWFKSWGASDPYRTAEDLAFAVAKFFQFGGTFQNYYMYHGGTNFGRVAAGYITTSYDYNAPLDEYGAMNQPKWGHLKQLHETLKSMEYTLTHGNITTTDLGNNVTTTVYATEESSSCFLCNSDYKLDANISFRGTNYFVPAWSVSILPDCKTEAYNTAKVNTQTTVKVKRNNKAEDEPQSLHWTWRPENIDETKILGKGEVVVNHLMEQKEAANDESDYLWYMTSVDLKKDDPIWGKNNITLRINGTGCILHAYVNGEHIGSDQAARNFERNVTLKDGRNIISLLSATTGFSNYGGGYDLQAAGILGPVVLVGQNGDETVIKDLSAYKWSYKVGLHGLTNKLFSSEKATKWSSENLPVNTTMTWYKTTFKAPLGTDPIVVDLQGLGKGDAWVNGHSIGRYWPSFLAKTDGCSDECDYRGKYESKKCNSKCGEPTQRWYHVPRSFMRDDDENTLVLFEEFGGNPSLVNFQTIAVGSVCANAYENNTLELACDGRSISAIKFASFGNPQGTCGPFKNGTSLTKGNCDGSNALSIIQKECVGKEKCSIDVSGDKFDSTNCGDIVKRLAVEAVC
ncbi:hypothetical protein ACLB2K_005481 [Fragaria x ananassa]